MRKALLAVVLSALCGCKALQAYSECPPPQVKPALGGGFVVYDLCNRSAR